MRLKILVTASAVVLAVLLAYGLGIVQTGFGSSPEASLPLADTGYVRSASPEQFRDAMMSGGPPKDGIPSIDDPRFLDASEADLEPGDMVIGFEHRGEARAYPHRILVHHEIVNDRVAGQNIAITYCPLTATAQGFERGNTTLGVSGRLVNSNLVMYDRETDSFFPQINALGIRGEYQGKTLVEVDLAWTTWERWRSAHPDTKVLSRETGYLRNYDRDPYGSYNPRGGYYHNDRVLFPLMNRSDRHPPKEMVVGARTSDHSVYFLLAELEREKVQTTDHFLAVYEPDLHTGHIYLRAADGPEVTARADGRYEVEGRTYEAGELPLESVISIQGFFFAWHAFFPGSETA